MFFVSFWFKKSYKFFVKIGIEKEKDVMIYCIFVLSMRVVKEIKYCKLYDMLLFDVKRMIWYIRVISKL